MQVMQRKVERFDARNHPFRYIQPKKIWNGNQDRLEAFRNRGKPLTRWTDNIQRIAGNWMQAAQKRKIWQSLREAFVQQWIV